MEKVDSKKLFENFMSDVEMVDPLMMKVPSEPEPGDQPVDTLSEDDWLRKLFIAMIWNGKRCKETMLELSYDKDNKNLQADVNKYRDAADAYSEIFWYLVKEKYNLWGHEGGVAIRKGFKIVTCKEEKNEPPDFIKKLFNLE